MDNESMMKLEGMHQQIKETEEKIGVVDQQIKELQDFEITLNELEKSKSKEIIASLGKGVYVKSDMKDEKLFLEVGAGVLVRKTISESKEIIKDQSERLQQIRMQIATEYENLYNNFQNLVGQIEEN